MRFLAVLALAGVCVAGYFYATTATPEKPIAATAGEHGFFTYTAIDGSTVTVARQSPDSTAPVCDDEAE